jgi:predicted GH43/DUF377 family glycosyl hydrolase
VTYIRTEKTGKKTFVIATSTDLYTWNVKTTLDIAASDTAFAVNAGAKANYSLYMGGLFVTLAKSKDLKHWTKEPGLLFTSRYYGFDSGDLRLIGAATTRKGILVFYDASYSEWRQIS